MNEFFIPPLEQKWVFHLIFIRIPKNASTSVYQHLGAFNLVNKYSSLFQKNLNKPLYKGWFDPTHAKPAEIASILPVRCFDYHSFAIVRNPWDRFVSMYSFANKMHLWKLFGLKEEPSFERFCEVTKEKFENKASDFFPVQDQTEWLCGPFEPKQILRFENLQTSFEQMLKDLRVQHIHAQLPHVNSSKHDYYKQYYNDKSRKLVEQIFYRDIEKFKYTF
jgi:hypothetical protein